MPRAEIRGRDLRMQRIRAGLSQAELARAMKVHRSLVSLAELETTSEYPSEEFAAKYLDACEAAVA